MLFLFIASIFSQNDVSAHNNVVIVVDASGSMNDDMSGHRKIIVAKDALKSVLKEIPQDTFIGIICFGGSSGWVYPIGIKNEVKINAAIDSIWASGGTPLGEYIKKGADALLQQRKKQLGYGSFRLLVVTDGEANDTNLVDKYVPDVISRNIILDVIGVNMESKHTLAKYAHSYRSANNLQQLHTAIRTVLAEISITKGDPVDFTILEPIPDNVVLPIISAFSQNRDCPIGDVTALDSSKAGFSLWYSTLIVAGVAIPLIGVLYWLKKIL